MKIASEKKSITGVKKEYLGVKMLKKMPANPHKHWILKMTNDINDINDINGDKRVIAHLHGYHDYRDPI